MIRVEGVEYTPGAVMDCRAELITMRDEALKQNAWEPTVLLSHVIAYLAEYAELLDEQATYKHGGR